MLWTAENMRRTSDGVRIETTRGTVLLSPGRNRIDARYLYRPLVNGTATAFAQRIRDEALQLARQVELPWTLSEKGSLRIKDHRQFYEQSFRPEIQAVETLLRWF